MTAIEEMCQVFAHSPEVQKRIEESWFRAEIFIGQNCFKGSAVFEFDKKGRGMFYPDGERPNETQLSEVIVLKNSNGQETVLKDFELCHAPAPLHYHFTFEANR